MDLQQLIDYIKRQLSQGISKEIVVNALTSAGWQSSDIEQAFNAINKSPTASFQSGVSTGIITEQNYPIENIWLGKSLIIYLIRNIILVIYLGPSFFKFLTKLEELNNNHIAAPTGWYLFIFIAVYLLPIDLIIAFLRRTNYHYTLDQQYLTLKQGILSKQQRNIPYGVIQNVYVKQDLFDRVFGLASLTLENASWGGKNKAEGQTKIFGMTINTKRRQHAELIGFGGNKVNIPGLKKKNAEVLKNIVLQKMKENPIDDSLSGL